MSTKDAYNPDCKSCRNQNRRNSYKEREFGILLSLKGHNKKELAPIDFKSAFSLSTFKINTDELVYVSYDPQSRHQLLEFRDSAGEVLKAFMFREEHTHFMTDELERMLIKDELRIFQSEAEIKKFQLYID